MKFRSIELKKLVVPPVLRVLVSDYQMINIRDIMKLSKLGPTGRRAIAMKLSN